MIENKADPRLEKLLSRKLTAVSVIVTINTLNSKTDETMEKSIMLNLRYDLAGPRWQGR